MAIPDALANAGTSLRATHVILQALDAPDFTATELETVERVKESSDRVVETLITLEAGTAQPLVSGKILPTKGIMNGTESAIQGDLNALDDIQEADMPDQFDDFELLRERIKELKIFVAAAARR